MRRRRASCRSVSGGVAEGRWSALLSAVIGVPFRAVGSASMAEDGRGANLRGRVARITWSGTHTEATCR
ncbi:hypothetical protein GCM10010363_54780 [Streptomyces omiyaensis]|nr:hypothetical protein GCM10010363_54780 [Streptomyces omiyaensis]